jgi:FKBP-type peptidyl-prolyl cis-trans isomerase FkpA
MKRILYITAILGLLCLSCKKKLSEEEQYALDKDIIEQYIEDNGLTANSTSSGLYYVITALGTGNHPNAFNDVTVRYTGKFTDNQIFDQSTELGATFNLQHVIKGWTEGIPLFKEGGEGILILPSKLAYGPNGNSSIPPNSVLVFDVELLDIID